MIKFRKAELIDLLVDLAEDDGAVMRILESAVDLDKPSDEIVSSARKSIADATYFDRKRINQNFDFDYRAYAAVARYFSKLIEGGHLRSAMSLTLELMERGSQQVEMSDEGLMTEEIEECIRVVIRSLESTDACSPGDVVSWCETLTEKDRGGFVCASEIEKLRESFE